MNADFTQHIQICEYYKSGAVSAVTVTVALAANSLYKRAFINSS